MDDRAWQTAPALDGLLPSSILHSPSAPLLLAGPTAVGKSTIALLLAERLGGEIISADSMQVYRGLDIGTAKATPEERRRVPHHLLDILDLTESFDAAQFVRRAHEAVADIQARGRVPILCGGTGLYFKAFLEGLSEAPSANTALRATLYATPLPELLAELQQRDPVTFEKIDRQNLRRVIRALEVIRLTGQPFSAQRADWRTGSQPSAAEPRERTTGSLPADRGRGSADKMSAAPSHPSVLPASRRQDQHPQTRLHTICPRLPQPAPPADKMPAARFFCFARSAEDLRARIDARVDQMFQRGLVDETQRLLAQGLAQNQTALQALGYRQVVEHLRGERPLAGTIDLVKIRTRQFAKRQMTWFRRQAAVTWIHLQRDQSLEAVAAQLAG